MLTGNFLIDNDSGWTLVPDDPVQIPAGLTPDSQRYVSDDAEYEDAVNYMRRKSYNIPRVRPRLDARSHVRYRISSGLRLYLRQSQRVITAYAQPLPLKVEI